MKRLIVAVVWTFAVLATSGAIAGKVNIPKEGNYAFDFCPIGQGKTFANGDKLFHMQYDLNALLRANPAGGAFDRMGARCLGLFTNINGKLAETGMCEITDLDGDKWWMDYHGNPDGAGGTYTAAGGTGKYDGMVGEYRLDNNWGSPSKEVAFWLQLNKGTYKLA
jgi:hypothetical protein